MEERQRVRWIKHYSSSHKILIVGEGDFSFSACLAKAFCGGTNMVATSLDTEDVVMKKHSTAKANLRKLKKLRCTVLHGVNAHTMNQHPLLNGRKSKFDRVVFNFPHAGFGVRTNESSESQIRLHQEVVRGFFKTARDMVTTRGEIHVTHKTGYPFSKWEVKKLAEETGLDLVEEVEFSRSEYPGYINKKGDGKKSNKTFRVGKCSTFKFARTARDMVTTRGEIHVTHKTGYPFSRWEAKKLTEEAVLVLAEVLANTGFLSLQEELFGKSIKHRAQKITGSNLIGTTQKKSLQEDRRIRGEMKMK